MSPTRAPIRPTEADFERQVRQVVDQVRAAIRGVIEATPGITRRPTDLKHTLGINAKMAWQVHRMANAEDPCAEVAHLPRPVSMERFLEAAARRGAPQTKAQEVREAVAAYEKLAQHHAGGRAEFESMVSNLAQEGAEHVDLTHKRAAFRAQSHFLGIQAEAHMACYMLKPAESDETMLDAIGLRGLIGLQRCRRDVGWIISTMRATNEDGTLRENTGPELLDSESDPFRVGLLRKFCSEPMPQIREVPARGGAVNVELQPDGLGASSAITCIVGHVFRSVFSRYPDETNQHLNSHVLVRTPCKVLVQDTLLHRDIVPVVAPRSLVYSDHRDVEGSVAGRERDLLSARETVTHMGRGVEVMETPEVPQHAEIARYAMQRAGWRPDEFEVYRTRIEYPVMPSSVVMQFDLPERP